MSQRSIKGKKKEHSKKMVRKNVSTTLSNVKDTKTINVFWLKIRWKIIMDLMMKVHLYY